MIRNQTILFSIFILTSSLTFSQTNSRTLEYYFNIVDSLEFDELKKAGVIGINDSIADEYFDKATQRLNERGFEKYAQIKVDVYRQFYSNYLLLQTIEFKDDVYVLYFSIAGFDDVEFQIIKWNQEHWKESDTLSKTLIDEPKQKFEKIAFNYDEGPKNLDNVRIFIRNDYLIMERGGLFHSLYDLRENELVINDESPWHSANVENLEAMNRWIKENLHLRIEEKINASR